MSRKVEIDEKWERVKKVGEGGSASVSLAVASRDGFEFAVKSASMYTSAVLDIMNERALLVRLSDAPNIIRCLGWADTDRDEEGRPVRSIFLEYMRGGSVQDLISAKGRLSEQDTRVYTRGIVRALDYMHSQGIVHCDVKCGNVLLETTEEVDDRVVMLADLGFAKPISAGQEGPKEIIRGTWSHLAPELPDSGRQLPPCDVWSLGCAVVTMLQGSPPWGNGPEAHARAKSGAPAYLPILHVSLVCQDFIARCLQREPSYRLTTRHLLHHPFLAPPPILVSRFAITPPACTDVWRGNP